MTPRSTLSTRTTKTTTTSVSSTSNVDGYMMPSKSKSRDYLLSISSTASSSSSYGKNAVVTSSSNPKTTTTNTNQNHHVATPGLHQVIALEYTYRRIVNEFFYFPKFICASMLIGIVVIGFIHILSGGMTLLALLLTLGILLIVYALIQRLATTQQSMRIAIRKNIVGAPIVALVFSCFVTRYYGMNNNTYNNATTNHPIRIIASFLQQFERSLFSSTTSTSGSMGLLWWWFLFAFRLSAMLAVLGLAVVALYIGPQSIMRCSCVPITINPTIRVIKEIREDPSSIITLMATPSDRHGDLLTFSGSPTSSRGSTQSNPAAAGNSNNDTTSSGGNIHDNHHRRRYVNATYRSILAQIVVSTMIGIAVAFGTAAGLFPGPDQSNVPMRTCTLICYVLSVLGYLVLGTILYSGHELDPIKYHRYSSINKRYAHNEHQEGQKSWRVVSSNLSKVLLWVGFCVCLSMIVTALISSNDATRSQKYHYEKNDDGGGTGKIKQLWSFYAVLYICCVLICLYLYTTNENIKYALFDSDGTALSFKRLVEELYENSTVYTRLDIVLHSLLRDNMLVSSVYESKTTSARTPGVWGLEEEERRRLDNLSHKLAHCMLSPPGGTAEAPLEEDILRVAVLESLMGGGVPSELSIIDELVDPKSEVGAEGGKNRWYLCIPLVRALCVFIGGIGEAILVCAGGKSKHAAKSIMIHHYTTPDCWSLPPGLFTCIEYAVFTLSQMMVRSMTTAQNTPIPDWKSSDLSILVPAALSSLFQLRSGMEKLTKAQQKSLPSPTTTDQSSFDTKSIRQKKPPPTRQAIVISICDQTAKDILSCLSTSMSYGRIDLGLDEDCSLWVKGLL